LEALPEENVGSIPSSLFNIVRDGIITVEIDRNSSSRTKCHLGDLGVDVRAILECILKKWGVKVWTGFIWLWMKSSIWLL
jgi:hypothetical protein